MMDELPRVLLVLTTAFLVVTVAEVGMAIEGVFPSRVMLLGDLTFASLVLWWVHQDS